MGVRGKRVHLIEQMSNCVVSFQKGTSGRLLSLLLSLTNNLLLLFLDLLTLLSLYIVCARFFATKLAICSVFLFSVDAGAKDRTVQVIGSDEGTIALAKTLIQETIQRNSSPEPPPPLQGLAFNATFSFLL